MSVALQLLAMHAYGGIGAKNVNDLIASFPVSPRFEFVTQEKIHSQKSWSFILSLFLVYLSSAHFLRRILILFAVQKCLE